MANFARSFRRLLPDPSRRCLVIALDGVGLEELVGAVDAGIAPTLGSLLERGQLTNMSSTFPPVAAVAWSSFMTACLPGRHGVFGFTQPQSDFTLRFTDARDLRMPTLWDRAATDGLRSVVVNVPGTYPARRVSGQLISGFVAPYLDRGAYPPSLARRLSAEGYVLDVDAELALRDPARFPEHLLEVLERRILVMESLLASERWSLAVLAFTEADRLQRMWFRQMRDEDGMAREAYRGWFGRVDAFLTRCLSRYSADILVISAYAFGPLKRFVNLDAWLRAHGYLHTDAAGTIAPGTRAFSMDQGRIYVASSEMFQTGSVARADVGRLVDEIADGLAQLTDPDTGRPVMVTIRKRRDAYEGARTYEGPNLACLPGPGYELKSSRNSPLFSDAIFEGTHTREGALLVTSGTAHGTIANVEDAGATVLAKLGLYDDDVDGSSLLR